MKDPKVEQFYYFDCMNAVLGDKLWALTAFEGDQDAKKTAADYKATLYKLTYENGERVACETLYDPWACFDEEGNE